MGFDHLYVIHFFSLCHGSVHKCIRYVGEYMFVYPSISLINDTHGIQSVGVINCDRSFSL